MTSENKVRNIDELHDKFVLLTARGYLDSELLRVTGARLSPNEPELDGPLASCIRDLDRIIARLAPPPPVGREGLPTIYAVVDHHDNVVSCTPENADAVYRAGRNNALAYLPEHYRVVAYPPPLDAQKDPRLEWCDEMNEINQEWASGDIYDGKRAIEFMRRRCAVIGTTLGDEVALGLGQVKP